MDGPDLTTRTVATGKPAVLVQLGCPNCMDPGSLVTLEEARGAAKLGPIALDAAGHPQHVRAATTNWGPSETVGVACMNCDWYYQNGADWADRLARLPRAANVNPTGAASSTVDSSALFGEPVGSVWREVTATLHVESAYSGSPAAVLRDSGSPVWLTDAGTPDPSQSDVDGL